MAREAQEPLRVLGVVRLSRTTDATTSPERQREAIAKWCAAYGGTLVGEATDLDVSGKVDPFERAGLGPWLTESPPQEWDTLVAWRLDRVSRSALDTLRLLEWLKARGKRLVTIDDATDTRGAMGQTFVKLAGVFAELERETIRERVLSSREKLRREGRWAGERVPFGYRPVPRDGGGWVLEVDPEKADTVRAMFSLAAAGESIAEIARRVGLNETTTASMLRNPAYRGHTVHKGEADTTVQKAPPLVAADLFEQAQAVRRGPRKRSDSPALAGVVLCWAPDEGTESGVCLRPMWGRAQTMPAGRGRMKNTTVYRYYYCREKGHGKSVRAERLESLAVSGFLLKHGSSEVTERVWVAASGAAAELAEVRLTLADVSRRLTAARSAAARGPLLESLDTLDARAAELEAAGDRPARWEDRPTGQTWREVLGDSPTPEALREALLRTGFRFAVHWGPDGFDLAIEGTGWGV